MSLSDIERVTPANWFYDVRGQLQRHIYDRSLAAFAAGDAARDAIQTTEERTARQRYIRERFLAGIGGLPPSDTPLNARTVGTVVGNGFRIEKVIFESRPRHYVTANLYLPDGADGAKPRGAVLYLSGHHREAKHAPEYQMVCQHHALAGLIVLAQDPIGQGERLGYWEPSLHDSTVPWGTTEHDHVGAQCLVLGDSLARWFLHDALRGLDYLASRPEVDASRIGVVGNSGGGTQTSLVLLAAADRIAAAAPATFVMNRETYMWSGGAQDAEQIWPGFTAAGLDHEDILLAMAPKPVRVLAVTGDFFPIEGTRRTVERCRRFWPDGQFDLVEDDSTHRFTPKLAMASAAFFARHLNGEEASGNLEAVKSFPLETLWCTTSGQVRGEIPDAESVYEANQARMAEVAPAALDDAYFRKRPYNHRRPCPFNPRFFQRQQVDELEAQHALYWSQEGVLNHAVAIRRAERPGPFVTLAFWDGGSTSLAPHRDWIHHVCTDPQGARTVLVVNLSGMGTCAPHPINGRPLDSIYGTLHKFATDLLFLDDDLASLRTYDVLRAIDVVREWPGLTAEGMEIYVKGRSVVVPGMLASRFHDVPLAEGSDTYSWAEWVSSRHYDRPGVYDTIVYGALRHGDL
jgi:hypothetical protein